MTAAECACRQEQTILRIESLVRHSEGLGEHAKELTFKMDHGAVLVQGMLPNERLRAMIGPLVRRAGVLARIDNRVRVGSAA